MTGGGIMTFVIRRQEVININQAKTIELQKNTQKNHSLIRKFEKGVGYNENSEKQSLEDKKQKAEDLM